MFGFFPIHIHTSWYFTSLSLTNGQRASTLILWRGLLVLTLVESLTGEILLFEYVNEAQWKSKVSHSKKPSLKVCSDWPWSSFYTSTFKAQVTYIVSRFLGTSCAETSKDSWSLVVLMVSHYRQRLLALRVTVCARITRKQRFWTYPCATTPYAPRGKNCDWAIVRHITPCKKGDLSFLSFVFCTDLKKRDVTCNLKRFVGAHR